MVACPKCELNNTLDSAYCRKCGYALPHDLIEEEQLKLKELVSKGMHSFSDGNTEEAMGIAEHAVMANPGFGDAHALKGMVHERRGEYAQALDCFETVVALNPDSTIDKIKLNQLRNAFAQRTAEPKVDRKSAALMALAATLLVSSVGAITYRIATSSKATSSLNTPNNLGPNNILSASKNPEVTSLGNVLNPNPSNPTPAQVTGQGEVKPLGQAGTPQQDGSRTGPALPRPGRDTYRSNSNAGDDIVITPLNPEGPIGKSGGSQGRGDGSLPPTTGGNVPGPTTAKGNNGSTEQPDSTSSPITRAEDPGQIDIKISSAKGGANGSEAIRRTANERMKGGDTEGAADAYEKASKSGSATGRTHQRQAQAYSSQGKRAEAIAAYERAISAYENDIKSGKGNTEASQAGLNSSKQALRVLKN